jgi:prevent-host-death family protein
MLTVNIHEAKTHLSRLLDRAARGEPVIIAKAGKPLVKVVPLETPAAGGSSSRVHDRANRGARRFRSNGRG